jgi:hypothetical protein
MPKDRKPTPDQAARAARLRGIIEGAAEGKAPIVPRTPREITDEAARKKWERLRKQK